MGRKESKGKVISKNLTAYLKNQTAFRSSLQHSLNVEVKQVDYTELSIALKDMLGKEDYDWLIEFAGKHKDKEIKEAESTFQVERVSKLRAMSTEGYLFEVLKDQDFEEKLMQGGLGDRDIKRISSIVAKLRFEKVWLDRTSI